MNQRVRLLNQLEQLKEEKKDFPKRADEIDQQMQDIGEQLINLTNEKRSAKSKQKSNPRRRAITVPKSKQADKTSIDTAKKLLETTDMSVTAVHTKTGVAKSTLYRFQKEIRENKPASDTKPSKQTKTTPNKSPQLDQFKEKVNALIYEKDKMKENWKKEQDKVLKLEDDLDKANKTINQLKAELEEAIPTQSYEADYNRLKGSNQQLRDSKTSLVQENDKLKRQLDNERKLSAYHKNEVKRALGLQETINKQHAKIQKLEQILKIYLEEGYELDQDIRSTSNVG